MNRNFIFIVVAMNYDNRMIFSFSSLSVGRFVRFGCRETGESRRSDAEKKTAIRSRTLSSCAISAEMTRERHIFCFAYAMAVLPWPKCIGLAKIDAKRQTERPMRIMGNGEMRRAYNVRDPEHTHTHTHMYAHKICGSHGRR